MRKDILGHEIKYDCLGCAIARGEMKLPGGAIYDGKGIVLAADPEIPIPGFLIITAKRHIRSFSEFTREERIEAGDILALAEKALKELGISQELTLVQEERAKHLHIWIFPHQDWMREEFGSGISYLREIMNHTREHAKESDLQAVLQSVEAVKAYFAENLGKDED